MTDTQPTSNERVSPHSKWLRELSKRMLAQGDGTAANTCSQAAGEIDALLEHRTVLLAEHERRAALEPSVLRVALEAIASPAEPKDFGWWTLTARKALGVATPREIESLRASQPPSAVELTPFEMEHLIERHRSWAQGCTMQDDFNGARQHEMRAEQLQRSTPTKPAVQCHHDWLVVDPDRDDDRAAYCTKCRIDRPAGGEESAP